MLCNECQKRPATIYLTKVENGKAIEVQVCEFCAKKFGYTNQQEDTYSIHELLSGLFNFGTSDMELKSNHIFNQMEEMECPKCHLNFKEFQKIGKFGCSNCYETFKGNLDTLLRRVHSGNIEHHGKIPKRQGIHLHHKQQLTAYREKLKQLIQNEKFEDAAIMRDKIKEMEQRGEGDDV